MPISVLPPAPLPTDDTATFNSKAFAFLGALEPFRVEANSTGADADADATAAAASAAAASASASSAASSVATAVATAQANSNASAAAAATSASDASASANAAAASAGATAWVSGTTYAAGARVWSLITHQLFWRAVAGAGTTDPANDSANWSRVRIEAETFTAESFFLCAR
jgi:hypothetical protein